MSLKGAKLIWIDKKEKNKKVIKLKNKKNFKFGYYMTNDFILENSEAKSVHCEIVIDAFNRVSILNNSQQNPILLNGFPVKTRRHLFHGNKIKIFDEEFLWHFPKYVRKKIFNESKEALNKDDPKTPIKDEIFNIQVPSSEPWITKNKRRIRERLSAHSFVQQDNVTTDESEDDLEFSDVETKCTKKTILNKKSLQDVKNRKTINCVSPLRDCETPALSLSVSEILQNTELNEKTPNKWLQSLKPSGTLLTSFSPIVNNDESTKTSFAFVKSYKNSPKSEYNTPKSVFSDVCNDSENISSDLISFSTPTTKINEMNSSMFLIDLTTPAQNEIKDLKFNKPSSCKTPVNVFSLKTPLRSALKKEDRNDGRSKCIKKVKMAFENLEQNSKHSPKCEESNTKLMNISRTNIKSETPRRSICLSTTSSSKSIQTASLPYHNKKNISLVKTSSSRSTFSSFETIDDTIDLDSPTLINDQFESVIEVSDESLTSIGSTKDSMNGVKNISVNDAVISPQPKASKTPQSMMKKAILCSARKIASRSSNQSLNINATSTPTKNKNKRFSFSHSSPGTLNNQGIIKNSITQRAFGVSPKTPSNQTKSIASRSISSEPGARNSLNIKKIFSSAVRLTKLNLDRQTVSKEVITKRRTFGSSRSTFNLSYKNNKDNFEEHRISKIFLTRSPIMKSEIILDNDKLNLKDKIFSSNEQNVSTIAGEDSILNQTFTVDCKDEESSEPKQSLRYVLSNLNNIEKKNKFSMIEHQIIENKNVMSELKENLENINEIPMSISETKSQISTQKHESKISNSVLIEKNEWSSTKKTQTYNKYEAEPLNTSTENGLDVSCLNESLIGENNLTKNLSEDEATDIVFKSPSAKVLMLDNKTSQSSVKKYLNSNNDGILKPNECSFDEVLCVEDVQLFEGSIENLKTDTVDSFDKLIGKTPIKKIYSNKKCTKIIPHNDVYEKNENVVKTDVQEWIENLPKPRKERNSLYKGEIAKTINNIEISSNFDSQKVDQINDDIVNLSGIGVLNKSSNDSVSDRTSCTNFENDILSNNDPNENSVEKFDSFCKMQVSQETIDENYLKAASELKELNGAFQNFNDQPKYNVQKSFTPETQKRKIKTARKTMDNNVCFDESFDFEKAKKQRELEVAFENFEDQPKLNGQKSFTPQAQKIKTRTARKTMGNNVCFDESFDLETAKKIKELETAFENFEDQPKFIGKKSFTPEVQKIKTRIARKTMGNNVCFDESFDLETAKKQRELEVAFENFEDQPKLNGQKSFTPQAQKIKTRTARKTMGINVCFDESFDLENAKKQRELEIAFENFKDQPKFTGKKSFTPEAQKIKTRTARKTMGINVCFDESFDLENAKKQRELEIAFENFKDQPKFTGKKSFTPEAQKIKTRTARKTMGNNVCFDESFDLETAKKQREFEVAFENFEDQPKLNGPKSFTPEAEKIKKRTARKTMGNNVCFDESFDLETAKKQRELEVAFENFEDQPKLNGPKSFTPEAQKIKTRTARKTMGNNVCFDESFDLETAKKQRELEVAFENFEDQPKLNGPKSFTPEAQKIKTRTARKTMGNNVCFDESFDLETAKKQRELEVAFENFEDQPKLNGPKSFTPEAQKIKTRTARKTMGNNVCFDESFDLETAKKQRELEVAFENFEDQPKLNGPKSFTPEAQKIKTRTARKTMGNNVCFDESFDLETAKKQRELEVAFENFEDQPKLNGPKSFTPEAQKIKTRTARKTMGNNVCFDESFDLETAKKQRELEVAFENFEDQPKLNGPKSFTPEAQKIKTRTTRKTMGNNVCFDESFDLETAKKQRELEVAFENFEDQPKFTGTKSFTPEAQKIKTRSARKTMGNNVCFDESFDLENAKKQRELEVAFENFEDQPKFTGKKSFTPEAQKIKTRTARKTMGNNVCFDESFDLENAKKQRELEVAFENFEDQPKFTGKKSFTPEAQKIKTRTARKTMGNNVCFDESFDLENAKKQRELEVAFENFEDQPKLNGPKSFTPEAQKIKTRTARKTMGNNVCFDESFDLENAKKQRELEVAFENFEDQPKLNGPKSFTPEAQKIKTRTARKTMGNNVCFDESFDLENAKKQRELEVAFENFEDQPKLNGPKSFTPEAQKIKTRTARKTMGNNVCFDESFDLENAKKQRELEVAFENFEDQPKLNGPKSFTPEAQKIKTRTARKTMGNNVCFDESFDLETAKKQRELEVAFENFEDQPKPKVIKSIEENKTEILENELNKQEKHKLVSVSVKLTEEIISELPFINSNNLCSFKPIEITASSEMNENKIMNKRTRNKRKPLVEQNISVKVENANEANEVLPIRRTRRKNKANIENIFIAEFLESRKVDDKENDSVQSVVSEKNVHVNIEKSLNHINEQEEEELSEKSIRTRTRRNGKNLVEPEINNKSLKQDYELVLDCHIQNSPDVSKIYKNSDLVLKKKPIKSKGRKVKLEELNANQIMSETAEDIQEEARTSVINETSNIENPSNSQPELDMNKSPNKTRKLRRHVNKTNNLENKENKVELTESNDNVSPSSDRIKNVNEIKIENINQNSDFGSNITPRKTRGRPRKVILEKHDLKEKAPAVAVNCEIIPLSITNKTLLLDKTEEKPQSDPTHMTPPNKSGRRGQKKNNEKDLKQYAFNIENDEAVKLSVNSTHNSSDQTKIESDVELNKTPLKTRVRGGRKAKIEVVDDSQNVLSNLEEVISVEIRSPSANDVLYTETLQKNSQMDSEFKKTITKTRKHRTRIEKIDADENKKDILPTDNNHQINNEYVDEIKTDANTNPLNSDMYKTPIKSTRRRGQKEKLKELILSKDLIIDEGQIKKETSLESDKILRKNKKRKAEIPKKTTDETILDSVKEEHLTKLQNNTDTENDQSKSLTVFQIKAGNSNLHTPVTEKQVEFKTPVSVAPKARLVRRLRSNSTSTPIKDENEILSPDKVLNLKKSTENIEKISQIVPVNENVPRRRLRSNSTITPVDDETVENDIKKNEEDLTNQIEHSKSNKSQRSRKMKQDENLLISTPDVHEVAVSGTEDQETVDDKIIKSSKPVTKVRSSKRKIQPTESTSNDSDSGNIVVEKRVTRRRNK